MGKRESAFYDDERFGKRGNYSIFKTGARLKLKEITFGICILHFACCNSHKFCNLKKM